MAQRLPFEFRPAQAHYNIQDPQGAPIAGPDSSLAATRGQFKTFLGFSSGRANGFKLELLELSDAQHLPDAGSRLVVVARNTADSTLRFKIFDGGGAILLDKSENEFPERSNEINDLKTLFDSVSKGSPSAGDKASILNAVTAITRLPLMTTWASANVAGGISLTRARLGNPLLLRTFTHRFGEMIAAPTTDEFGEKLAFDVALRPDASAPDIPSEPKKLVVVLRGASGKLHFKVFGSEGEILVDKSETDFPTRASVAKDLSLLLSPLWEQETLSASQSTSILEAVASITGLPDDLAGTDYWYPEPHTTDGHSSAHYYWSIHAERVYATEPGPVTVVWRKAQPLEEGGGSASATPDVGVATIVDAEYTIYTNRYFVSTEPVKRPRKIYWTEGSSAQTGKPITVPTERVRDINIIYSRRFPESVAFNVSLMSVADFSALPNAGSGLAVVARHLPDQTLRFRVFDREGNLAVDKSEADFPAKSDAVVRLKSLLDPLWSAALVSVEDRYKILEAVATITGQPAAVDRPSSNNASSPVPVVKTLWYDEIVKALRASNLEGRVFVEFLGDKRTAGDQPIVRHQLGYELVEVIEEPTAADVTVELGEVLPPFQGNAPAGTPALQPDPVLTVGQSFAFRHTIAGSDRFDYYAVRETKNQNDFQMHWMEEGLQGLLWPYRYVRYRMVWPADVSRYSHYVRPLVETEEEARATAVPLPAASAPQIAYQDPLDKPRGKLTESFAYYSFLDNKYPAHRALLQFTAGEYIRFERVFSWLDGALRGGSGGGGFAGSLAANLSAWDADKGTFVWPDEFVSPRVVTQTVYVGQRITAPDGELGGGLDPDYLAGYIQDSQGDSYHPTAYVDPFASGFELANQGAIIPVNAIPGKNQLEVWWFRKNTVDISRGFQASYWPAVIGRYTIQWPTDGSEIILASNDGSGPLPSLEATGSLYYENDRAKPGFNPNEEHALMQGGQVYALRDDLNITGPNPSTYSSHPYVLLEYTAADGRLAIRTFHVRREKPEAGITFEYAKEAGSILQAPMPLPLMGAAFAPKIPGHSRRALNQEIVSWLVSSAVDTSFDVRLVSGSDPMPQTGSELVLLTRDLVGALRFRVFDSDGRHVMEATEIDFLPERASQIDSLKETLAPTGGQSLWELDELSEAQKAAIVEAVRSITGQPGETWTLTTEGTHAFRPFWPLALQHAGEPTRWLYARAVTHNTLTGVVSDSPPWPLMSFPGGGEVPGVGSQWVFGIATDASVPNGPAVLAVPSRRQAWNVTVAEAPAGEGYVRLEFGTVVPDDATTTAIQNGAVLVTSTSGWLDGNPDSWTLSWNKPPVDGAGSDLAALYASATVTDRKGNVWVYRGPHFPDKEERFTLRFYYNTLPGFFFPSLPIGQQPPVGTATPYLRHFNAARGQFVGDAVYGNKNGDQLADDNALGIIYKPVWPENAPVLQMAETLTNPKRGLPAVRGQSSAEVLYQQSLVAPDKTIDRTRPSVVLHDPTREKTVEFDRANLPDSINTATSRGKIFFPNLPPHLVKRFWLDPNRGANGALVFAGEFIDSALGDDYLLLNVAGQGDVDALLKLCKAGDPKKESVWIPAINGLETVMEQFVENEGRPGTYVPLPRLAHSVGLTEVAAVKDDDVAVDSYALTAVGPGTGYVSLIVGNGEAFTPTDEPVSVHVLRVAPELYRGEVKVIAPENPLSEKLTLQQVVDLAGKLENYQFEWRIAAPVDGQPPGIFEKEILPAVALAPWSHVRFPLTTDSVAGIERTPQVRVVQDFSQTEEPKFVPVSELPFGAVSADGDDGFRVVLAYGVRLAPDLEPSSLPESGRRLVFIGRYPTGLLHLRVFDAEGWRVLDGTEAAFTGKSAEIAALKALLGSFWDKKPLTLTDEEEESIREAVREIADAGTNFVPQPPLHRLAVGNQLVMRSEVGAEMDVTVWSLGASNRSVNVKFDTTQPVKLKAEQVFGISERVLDGVPQSIAFSHFDTPPAETLAEVWLGVNQAQGLGAKIYVNGALVAITGLGSEDTPADNPASALRTPRLARYFKLAPSVLAGATDTPDGLKQSRLAVEFFTPAGPGSLLDFEVRIEGFARDDLVAALGSPWLPLQKEEDEEDEPDLRAVLGGTATVKSLTDNYLTMRYAQVTADGNPIAWSPWTEPQLAEGWIKRVLAGINPFNQRLTDLFENSVSTDASLITQAGPRWEGDIALNLDSINDYGLIEIYETVLNRGRNLSIDADINYGPANDALLLAAGYLNDLYMMLGNEAAADAANPTIGIGTADSTYGDIATALFSFKGQLPSLLEEELSMLRGRDDFLVPGVETRPVYNRMVWNYTRGIDAGEVVYALNYNILDQNTDGRVDAADAQRLYPQGHGDAYGHYLTALKGYYRLFLNPNFDWVPRSEAVLVLGKPVTVDYQDERKLAAAAGALARTGKQIFDLTWRKDYRAGSGNGWSHFRSTRDSNKRTRNWGLDHWASRTAQGAYFNWIVGNAIVPETDPDPAHRDTIQQVDRTTVPELKELPAVVESLQVAMDNAESGLTPLGLPESTVPFDLNPNVVVSSENQTHFDQIYARAIRALDNAVTAFDDTKDVTRLMRSEEDSLADLRAAVDRQELAYTNALIELFGTPYPEDIGPGKTYRTGYAGPDLVHFSYIDIVERDFNGLLDPAADVTFKIDTQTFTADWLDPDGISDFNFIQPARNFPIDGVGPIPEWETNSTLWVEFNLSAHGFFEKPETWTGRRASPGKIQQAISDIVKARNAAYIALYWADAAKYDLDWAIQSLERKVESHRRVRKYQIAISRLDTATGAANLAYEIFDKAMELSIAVVEAAAKTVDTSTPRSTIVGLALGGDLTSAFRGILVEATHVVKLEMMRERLVAFSLNKALQEANADAKRALELDNIAPEEWNQELRDATGAMRDAIYGMNNHFMTINARLQELDDAQRRYRTLLAEGDRIQQEREIYRERTAAIIQGYRTRDAAFRIFRNEKLERYKTLFDLAAEYAFMAAKAYDYETGLLGTARGREFIQRIVEARALGVVQNGEPQFAGSNTGDPGLSSVLAEMHADWDVVKGRLGFNNPDAYGTTVSLRYENFRITSTNVANPIWQNVLHGARRDNLLDDPDVRRYCLQLDGGDGLPVPGFVFEFSTTIADGLNLFGRPIAGGDSRFPVSSFATKIFAAGVALEGYVGMADPAANAGVTGQTGGDPDVTFLDPDALAATPYLYLVPVGVDSMRSPPLGDASQVRTWSVDDVAVPLPFNIGGSDFSTKTLWQSADSLTEELFAIRKHQAFRPVSSARVFSPSIYTSSGGLQRSQFTNNRLIGRSVWNSKWKLVIPGKELLANPNEGIERFLRTVSDIKLHFVTYSYSGN